MPPLPSRRLGILATLLAAVLWGTSFPVNQLGLEAGVPPAVFAAGRFAVAAVAVLPFLWASGRLGDLRSWWPWALGLVNAAAFVLQYVGQTLAPAGSASFLINVNAVTVALLSWFVLGERPRAFVWFALVAGVGGVVALGVADAALVGGDLSGHLLVLAAGAMWSVYFVGSKRALDRGGSVGSLSAATFVATAAALSPALAWQPTPVSWPTLWPVLYTGLFCTVAAFGAWLWGLRAVGATTSAVGLLLEVGVASVLGWWFLAEAFPPLKVVGVGLIVLAVVGVSAPTTSGGPDDPRERGPRGPGAGS